MGEILGLSRPTMSAAIGELKRHDYVQECGQSQGPTGRKATVYRIGTGAGYAIGIDAGSSRISLRAVTLDNRILHEDHRELPAGQRNYSAETSKVVSELTTATLQIARNSWGPLRTLGIALPTLVSHDYARQELLGRQNLIFEHFTPPKETPVLLENNVNCAAIAEHTHGAAIGYDNFAYVQIGLKIGLGLLLRGELHRGKSGAAGEVSHLPFPWGPDASPEPEGLEKYLGAETLMQRVQLQWPKGATPPETSLELFGLATEGDVTALGAVRTYAFHIAQMVAACVGIVDPGFIVLGGGIGQNAILAPMVQAALDQNSYPTQVETSGLGSDATILGITQLATTYAQRAVLQ